MNSIAVSTFRSSILKFLKRVMQGEEISITQRGKTVAWLVPPTDKQAEAIKKLRALRKKAKVGDVITPVGATDWKVLK